MDRQTSKNNTNHAMSSNIHSSNNAGHLLKNGSLLQNQGGGGGGGGNVEFDKWTSKHPPPP